MEMVLTLQGLGQQLLVLVEQCLELHHQSPVLLLQLGVKVAQRLVGEANQASLSSSSSQTCTTIYRNKPSHDSYVESLTKLQLSNTHRFNIKSSVN